MKTKTSIGFRNHKSIMEHPAILCDFFILQAEQADCIQDGDSGILVDESSKESPTQNYLLLHTPVNEVDCDRPHGLQPCRGVGAYVTNGGRTSNHQQYNAPHLV